MNCKDVGRFLSEESPLPVQAQEHVKSCYRCQELVSALNMSVAVDPPSPATLRHIAEGIATNLRPVRPLAPAAYFFGALLAIFVSIVALGAYRMGPRAISVMSPLQSTAILSALAIGTGLLAYSLVLQMTPGSRHRIPPGLLPLGITIC